MSNKVTNTANRRKSMNQQPRKPIPSEALESAVIDVTNDDVVMENYGAWWKVTEIGDSRGNTTKVKLTSLASGKETKGWVPTNDLIAAGATGLIPNKRIPPVARFFLITFSLAMMLTFLKAAGISGALPVLVLGTVIVYAINKA